ncbi:MAG: hypothetical protein GFH27_549279n29 [Chloroflexi bacterium AL-W]|nr:hypothetical protein [Chloroflexi bacterium AL-N1]NOK71039.1 hypothetical protein [Chloroflexi bacterium AL-N10]NOK72738.1 hypothetical protein [Chloroflexi bacterium AL-N5]NOK79174.1 hypothetical protein [Chloroflexi bacterium AL-W]NOK87089.1 hypothetical protein [Chloroflexi bacterium AL-N15]
MNVLLTVEDIAPVLRITERTANDLARRGELPGTIKVGKVWRFKREEMESLIGQSWPEPQTDNNVHDA